MSKIKNGGLDQRGAKV